MHIHILGICGTFMGSLAVLAKEQGIRVTGCDQNVYPPMSTQLEAQGIELIQGFETEQLALGADLYVIGNAISRGNPLLEAILDKGLPYTSGPGMLAQHVLPGKWVLAVSGTHGKTTTTSMLAWILEYAGMKPGFLIGGVPQNFECSARLGETPFFVIEADEYDSAFFDKRSKFVHYRPRTLIVNNLEYDHADIFPDLASIQRQFHHLIRTVPQSGRVIFPEQVSEIDEVLARGCWSERQAFGAQSEQDLKQLEQTDKPVWNKLKEDGSQFEVRLGRHQARVNWNLSGDHNVLNGVAALLAARHVGVELAHGAQALSAFKGVKRRMEKLGQIQHVSVYDDFAHHPTAITSTFEGLRRQVGKQSKIIALIEPRSNTMRMGVHQATLLSSADAADAVCWADLSDMGWLHELLAEQNDPRHQIGESVEALLDFCLANADTEQGTQQDVHIVLMSNGGFAGIHGKLLDALNARD